MIHTDILIIGAGPVGLFTVFEAGLLQLRCHLIDSMAQPGGQCAEIYPKKPIYDIPGYPEILAGELVDRLLEQIEPFQPGFTLAERAETIEKLEDGRFRVTTNLGAMHEAPVVIIAGGLGSFEPRKPPIPDIGRFEGKGVEYLIKDPEQFRHKRVVIGGGGDSALDWTIHLAELTRELTLVHRRNEFRGAPDSVEKVQALARDGKINLVTQAEVQALWGNGKLDTVVIQHTGGDSRPVAADYYLPLFGLAPKLGPIGGWGLDIEDNAIRVNNALDFSTNIPGIFAVGDVNTYPGKLKLILCGFHEATVAVQFAYNIIHPGKRLVLKYTTVNGITGFNGQTKTAGKPVLTAL